MKSTILYLTANNYTISQSISPHSPASLADQAHQPQPQAHTPDLPLQRVALLLHQGLHLLQQPVVEVQHVYYYVLLVLQALPLEVGGVIAVDDGQVEEPRLVALPGVAVHDRVGDLHELADDVAGLFQHFPRGILLVVLALDQARGELQHELAHGWPEVGDHDHPGLPAGALDHGDHLHAVDGPATVLGGGAVGGLVVGHHPLPDRVVDVLQAQPLALVGRGLADDRALLLSLLWQHTDANIIKLPRATILIFESAMEEQAMDLIYHINRLRIGQGAGILWPDYEVVRHLVRGCPHSLIYQYCNMLDLLVLCCGSREQVLASGAVLGHYTHACIRFAADQGKQTALRVYLSRRSLAVDSIYKFRASITVNIVQFDRHTHVSALVVRDSQTNKSQTITPKNMVKQHNRVIVQVEGEGYADLCILAASRVPYYSCGVEDNREIIEGSALAYQMELRYFGSWEEEQYEGRRELLSSLKKGIMSPEPRIQGPFDQEQAEAPSSKKTKARLKCKTKASASTTRSDISYSSSSKPGERKQIFDELLCEIKCAKSLPSLDFPKEIYERTEKQCIFSTPKQQRTQLWGCLQLHAHKFMSQGHWDTIINRHLSASPSDKAQLSWHVLACLNYLPCRSQQRRIIEEALVLRGQSDMSHILKQVLAKLKDTSPPCPQLLHANGPLPVERACVQQSGTFTGHKITHNHNYPSFQKPAPFHVQPINLYYMQAGCDSQQDSAQMWSREHTRVQYAPSIGRDDGVVVTPVVLVEGVRAGLIYHKTPSQVYSIAVVAPDGRKTAQSFEIVSRQPLFTVDLSILPDDTQQGGSYFTCLQVSLDVPGLKSILICQPAEHSSCVRLAQVTPTQPIVATFRRSRVYECLLEYYAWLLGTRIEYVRLDNRPALLDHKHRPFRRESQGDAASGLVKSQLAKLRKKYYLYEEQLHDPIPLDIDPCCPPSDPKLLIDADSLKLVLGSCMLALSDETAILMFVAEYYQLAVAQALMGDPLATPQQAASKMHGELFQQVRLCFIHSANMLRLARSKPWLTHVPAFSSQLERAVTTNLGMAEREEEWRSRYRVSTRDPEGQGGDIFREFGCSEMLEAVVAGLSK